MTMETEKTIWKALETVIDPELYISLVDLGLIYDVSAEGESVKVLMTLTTLGCPLFPVIEKDIKNTLLELEGVTSVDVEVTFDPPWSTDRMSEKGKAILGI